MSSGLWPRPIFRVTDLAASTVHYRDSLGFQIDWEDATGGRPTCAQVSRDGLTIILDENAAFPKAAAPSVISVTLNDAPEAPGLDDLHGELAAAEARVARAPFKVVWDAAVHELQVEDLDGNVLVFWGHVAK